MADAKISQLPDGGDLQPTDQVPVNRAGTTMRAALAPGGAGVLSGNGSPNGVITPSEYGVLYRDLSNGALYVYVGDGDAPWVICGGDIDPSNATDQGYPVGVSHSGTHKTRLLASPANTVVVSDAAAQNGSGNGIYWNAGAHSDGSQILDVQTGPVGGAFVTRLADQNGHMRPSTLVLTNHAAPADADLAAGDCALWFDQTNGAAKLMIKGKSANGTVVTGAVNLT